MLEHLVDENIEKYSDGDISYGINLFSSPFLPHAVDLSTFEKSGVTQLFSLHNNLCNMPVQGKQILSVMQPPPCSIVGAPLLGLKS